MEKVKIFIIDFVGFYMAILIETFRVALSVLTYSIKNSTRGIMEIARPLVQQSIEIITHVSITVYHELLLALSFLLIKISEVCMKVSRNLHNQARYIQNTYRWL